MKRKFIFYKIIKKKNLLKNIQLYVNNFIIKKTELFLFLGLLKNILIGFQFYFYIEMNLKGLGYKIVFIEEKKEILIDVGLSHFYKLSFFTDIFFKIKKNNFCLFSYNKQKLFQVANIIYKLKPRDIYKGKGFNFVYGSTFLKIGKKR